MTYTTPILRRLEDSTAVASCTPCRPRGEDIVVGWEYSQVGPFGFCNTLTSDIIAFRGDIATADFAQIQM